jgi:Ca-activated chloride channel family protein
MRSLQFTVYGLRFGRNILFLPAMFFLSFSLHAQSERNLVREGNKLYKEKKYSDAEVSYKKSLNAKKSSPTGQFNLGDAYYKQGKYDEAALQFQPLTEDKNLSKEQKSKAYHNLGNSLLQSKKYDESVNAYKNALKLNSKDNDTRYNLAYAQSMLQQQKQQQQQNKDNKDKQDQKKDQQQQQQQNKDQQKKEQQKQEQKQAEQKQKISKEDAEKILQALNNDEKNTQKKFVKKESTRVSIEKNW